jgi:hypothetical protein
MKHQQGAPNALRSIARYKIGYATDDWGMRTSTPSGIPDPAGSWVRYADHVAALIETKHPTHESQADSELTDGDIKWQCGPLASGFTSPQPAPSAAVALSDDLRDRLVAISEAVADQDDRAAQAMLREILKAPQTSPTPQADSQPAEVWGYPPLPDFDTVEQHIYGACRRYITQDMLEPIRNLIRDAIDADRAARAPADSVPAWANQAVIEYRYTGGTHWCPLGPAERMKPNFDGVYRLQGGVFPVDAPADSVLEDAARYRWLRLALADRTNNGKSHWFCSIAAGHPEELDAAIDASRKQGGA